MAFLDILQGVGGAANSIANERRENRATDRDFKLRQKLANIAFQQRVQLQDNSQAFQAEQNELDIEARRVGAETDHQNRIREGEITFMTDLGTDNMAEALSLNRTNIDAAIKDRNLGIDVKRSSLYRDIQLNYIDGGVTPPDFYMATLNEKQTTDLHAEAAAQAEYRGLQVNTARLNERLTQTNLSLAEDTVARSNTALEQENAQMEKINDTLTSLIAQGDSTTTKLIVDKMVGDGTFFRLPPETIARAAQLSGGALSADDYNSAMQTWGNISGMAMRDAMLIMPPDFDPNTETDAGILGQYMGEVERRMLDQVDTMHVLFPSAGDIVTGAHFKGTPFERLNAFNTAARTGMEQFEKTTAATDNYISRAINEFDPSRESVQDLMARFERDFVDVKARATDTNQPDLYLVDKIRAQQELMEGGTAKEQQLQQQQAEAQRMQALQLQVLQGLQTGGTGSPTKPQGQ